MTTSLPGQAKAAPPDELGLYVHVPFCASTCDFCAFYQEPPTAAAIRAYLEGIEAEAALVDWPGPATTVFFGVVPGPLLDMAHAVGNVFIP